MQDNKNLIIVRYKEESVEFMIKLDYRTYNPRWGLSGIHFKNWEGYCLTLGFLANINHHKYYSPINNGIWNNAISIHIERNDKQGAWDKQGRICYYRDEINLQNDFHDLNNCKSAGVSNITCRINSNDYVISLVDDYKFNKTYANGNLTADIIPPGNAYGMVRQILMAELSNVGITPQQLGNAMNYFDIGWNK